MVTTINITFFNDYREIVASLCQERKISYKTLSVNGSIHTSYFSRVMMGRADFSQDQLFLVGRGLALQEWEMEYFLLLGEHSSSGNKSRKNYLWNKIEAIKERRQKVISELTNVYSGLSPEDKGVYYQSPVTAKVHMYLTIEKYRLAPSLIGKKISLSENRLQMELQKLIQLNLIKREKGEIKVLAFNVHLDEADPLSAANHINWRLESVHHLQQREIRPSDYHLSAIFSTDEESKIKIKELFKKFVVEAQKEASKVKANEEVYHISFDLF